MLGYMTDYGSSPLTLHRSNIVRMELQLAGAARRKRMQTRLVPKAELQGTGVSSRSRGRSQEMVYSLIAGV